MTYSHCPLCSTLAPTGGGCYLAHGLPSCANVGANVAKATEDAAKAAHLRRWEDAYALAVGDVRTLGALGKSTSTARGARDAIGERVAELREAK